MLMYAYFMHTLYYIHAADTCMTAVCINVNMIMFNVYVTALACDDGYARAAGLITDRLRIALSLITDSCYRKLASLYKLSLLNYDRVMTSHVRQR